MGSGSNFVFWSCTAVFLAAGAFFVYYAKHQSAGAFSGVYIDEKPRTLQPVEEYTKFYTQKKFKAHRENGSDHGLTYYWYQPEPPYPDGLKFPLVLLLHGGTGNSYAGKFLIQKDIRLEFPAFIVVPVLSATKTWAFTSRMPDFPSKPFFKGKEQDLPDAIQLIANLASEYPIDINRIYVVGCSEGGVGVFGAARYYSDVFAAGIAISGGWAAEDAPQMTNMPLLAIHGSLDKNVTVSLSRNMVAAIRKAGGQAEFIEIPDMGHECPSSRLYSKSVWKWLFSRERQAL